MEFNGFDTNFSLQGKVAIVTGGAAGIGYAIAQLFYQKGACVVLADRAENVTEVAQALNPDQILGLYCDVSDRQSVSSMLAATLQRFGRVDILVNSAGIVALDPAEKVSDNDWNRTLAVNLTGTFLTCQVVGEHLIKQHRGKIINLASQAGVVALPNHLAYCTSKAGVIGMTQVLALEWGPVGVQVNAISPTVVLTELGKKAWSGEVAEEMKLKIPTRRFAYPEEIAACALFLASDAADMVTGANLVIDGGYTIQ